jgi:hypothetical protein
MVMLLWTGVEVPGPLEEDHTRFDAELFPTGQGEQSVKSSPRVREDQRVERYRKSDNRTQLS